MRSSFGRDSSDGYCVAFAQTLGHVLIAYTPVGLYAGSLSRPRLTSETSVIPAYSKFGDRNFAPSGQRGRRDLAAYAARTRLSLRSIFRRILVPFFCGKMVRNPIQSLSHAPHDSSLYTREPWWGRGSVASALCPREPWLGTRLCCQRPLHKGARVLGACAAAPWTKEPRCGDCADNFCTKTP